MRTEENIVFFANTLWFFEKFKFNLIEHVAKSSKVYCLYLKNGPPVDNNKINILKGKGVIFQALTFYICIKTIANLSFNLRLKYTPTITPNKVIVFTVGPIILSSVIFIKYRKETIYVLEGLGRIFTSQKISYRIIKRFLIGIYRILFSKCNSVLTLNYSDAMYLAEMKIAPLKKIKLLPGTGLDIGQIDKELKFNQIEPKYIDFIARLIPEKGVYNFIYSRINLLKYHPNFAKEYKFRIITPESDIDSLPKGDIDYLNSLGIIVKPYLTNTIQYYKQSRAVVIPTKYGEGLSRVALEASYLGIPLLVSRNRGTEDFLPLNYKYYIASQNPSSIANQLVEMLEDIEYFIELRKNRCQLLAERYSTHSSIETFCSLILESYMHPY